ncbi:MAG: histidine phosphatase family protein [Pseudomonadota bacterium]
MSRQSNPVATRICFVRHGETDWNVEKRIQGMTDIPLNEMGRGQAQATAFNAAHVSFKAIYSSDLVRAIDTARVLAEREGQEVKLLPQLRERNYGIFQGITAAEGERRYPEAYKRYMARDPHYDFETGESLFDFASRVVEAVNWMVRHHPGQTIAAVTHGGVLDILFRKATGRPLSAPRDFRIPNCGLNWFRFDGRGWHLESWADRHHSQSVPTEAPE